MSYDMLRIIYKSDTRPYVFLFEIPYQDYCLLNPQLQV